MAARDLHVVHSTVVLVLAGRESATTRETTIGTRPGDLMPPPAGTLVDLPNEPGPSGAYEAASVAPDLSVTFSEAPGATSVDSAEALTVPEEFRAALLRARDVVLDPTVPLAVARHAVAEVSTWLDVHGPRFAGERPNRFSDRLRAHIAG